MAEENDCVWCKREVGSPVFCNFYNEPIRIRGLLGAGRAVRFQDYCKGFELKPHMRNSWEKAHGKRR